MKWEDGFVCIFIPCGNENIGVDAAPTASSDSPLDCRILGLWIRPPAARMHKKTNPERIGLFVASLVEMNLRNTIEGRTERKSLCNGMYY